MTQGIVDLKPSIWSSSYQGYLSHLLCTIQLLRWTKKAKLKEMQRGIVVANVWGMEEMGRLLSKCTDFQVKDSKFWGSTVQHSDYN